MKPFFTTQTCYLSTLTPVHIGSGEDYYPTNYVMDDGYLHYFGEMQLAEALTPAELQTLAGYADDNDGQRAIRQIQGFIHQKRERLAALSQHSIPVTEGVLTVYARNIGQTAQRETGGRNVSNQLTIQRNTFNPHDQNPYLPGSSLKGALRTALQDSLRRKKGNVPWVTQLQQAQVRYDQDKQNDRRRAGRDFEKTLRVLNREACQGLFEFTTLAEDPLRLLKVSDAAYRHPDGLGGLEVRYAVNRKRKRSDKPTRADSGPPILLECLAAHRSRCFTAELTLLEGQQRSKLPFQDFSGLAKIISGYAVPQFKAELEILNALGFVDSAWYRGIQELLKGELGQAIVAGQASLIRLGRYGGAEAKTLNDLRRIKIMQGPNRPANYADSSTTVWLAAQAREQQTAMLPFGWVLAEWNDQGLPETHAWLRQLAQPAYDRLEGEQQRRQAVIRRQAEKAEQQAAAIRRAEEEAEQARLAAAEQARLAALPPEQQAIAAFRSEYEALKQQRYQPGGTFDEKRRSFFRQALEWHVQADRQAAAALLRETIRDWTDWPAKKERKQEFREWLNNLEQTP